MRENSLKEPIFYWDKDTKTASCILTDGKYSFTGVATCCPEDYDMCNDKTGLAIAYKRATIKYYIHLRDNDIKPSLAALKKLYSEMQYSKKFNKDSYEAKSLRKHIYRTQVDLDTIQELIQATKMSLKDYITGKDNFYKKIRLLRENAKEKNK